MEELMGVVESHVSQIRTSRIAQGDIMRACSTFDVLPVSYIEQQNCSSVTDFPVCVNQGPASHHDVKTVASCLSLFF